MSDFDGASFASAYGPPVTARDVLAALAELLRREPPWSDMHLDDRPGEWRHVVVALLEDRTAVTGGERRSRLRWAAQRHGRFRRAQCCGRQHLAEELLLLEEAISEVMHRSGRSSRSIAQVLDTLAPDLRSIGRALHAGYVDGPSFQRRHTQFEEFADPEE